MFDIGWTELLVIAVVLIVVVGPKDLPPMLRSGLAITVPAAPALVKKHAHVVTEREGGRGAVREICEFIMQAQGTLDAQMAQYLK